MQTLYFILINEVFGILSMIRVATAKEMQAIDRTTIVRYGVPGQVLMERAGLSVVGRIRESYPGSPVCVICGGGNNGGDGFVIARILHNDGRRVTACMVSPASKLKGDALANYQIARKFGVTLVPLSRFLDNSSRFMSDGTVVVDALLGTGLDREVRRPFSDIIAMVNRSGCPVVAVDIPSGISSDTGMMMGTAIKADMTVTFGLPKRGHLIHPGATHSGRLYVEEIGFPVELLESSRIKVSLVEKNDIVSAIPSRPSYSHKGSYGHVLIVAGSRGKTGAALMAARACLRSGAGLVTLGVPESLVKSLQSRVTEEMILPLPEQDNGTLSASAEAEIGKFLRKKRSVLAIGPGITSDDDIRKLMAGLVVHLNAPAVIDADGLNALQGQTALLKRAGAPVVLTPHPGEMTRLLSRGRDDLVDIDAVERDRIGISSRLAARTGAIVVLKGAPTVTALPDGRSFVNSSGNPGMATAGSGDVLTGIIAALIGQGLQPAEAACCGVYIHGLAGDICARKVGRKSLVASDIIRSLPSAFRDLGKF
jgi:NAD(P)H-hydrate epimerase